MNMLRSYAALTVRMCYYRLVAVFNYPNDRKFYKRLQYSLKVLRKFFPELNQKLKDPTRPVRIPKTPYYSRLELWMEKASLELVLRKLAERYHVPILAERGFGSLSMFVKAVERAKRRRVEKILFISDHDPSGLAIEEFTAREMPVEIHRIGLSMSQIKRYHLPSIRVKRSDSRSAKYLQKYGDRAWESEALSPRVLLRIVEQKLRENIPKEFLAEVEFREKAERITKPVERRVIERMRVEASELVRGGISSEEILERLSRRYEIPATGRAAGQKGEEDWFRMRGV